MNKRKFAVNEFRNLIMPGMLLAAVIVVILSSFGLKMIEEAKEQVTNDYMADVKELSQIYNKQLYAIDTVASLISREAISKGDLFDASVIDSLKAASENLLQRKTENRGFIYAEALLRIKLLPDM